MHKMFRNYDNNIDADLSAVKCSTCACRAPGYIYNVKDEIIGITKQYMMPFLLYFNLQEASGANISDLILNSTITFKIIGNNHKTILEKVFPGSQIYNIFTRDLTILVTQEEAKLLKQETYGLSVSCETADGVYHVFTEADAYLVIR